VLGEGAGTGLRNLSLGYDYNGDFGWLQSIHDQVSYTPFVLQASGGNVGIGTTNPGALLDISGGSSSGLRISGLSASNRQVTSQLDFYNGYASSANIQGQIKSIRGNNDYKAGQLAFFTSAVSSGTLAERVTIDEYGNVGIGATGPAYRFSVQDTTATQAMFYGYAAGGAHAMNGLIRLGSVDTSAAKFDYSYGVLTVENTYNDASGDIRFRTKTAGTAVDALTITGNGNVNVAGTINARYQDVAEWVPSSEQLAAGTVVVLDSTKSNQVISSSTSYDTRVAGVISAQPGIALGEKSDSKVLVATTGRVKVKVDASKGPINIGDLLVTSDVRGVAMRSEPVEFAGRKMHMPGTLIGKALEPLEKGSGEILVLLSLQ
jgi:hypothetical protein